MNNVVSKINRDILAVLLLFILTFPSYRNLLQPGYFSMHDDVQVMRLYEMNKCFIDGQIPCRWIPDMGAGYGHPLYNYHPVLPYYLGMVFRVVGVDFITTSKLLFLSSLILASIFMYFLGREFSGRVGGMAAALFYTYAPYHAVDIYVRGALTESFGIVFFPLILLSLYRYLKEGQIFWFLVSAVSLAALALSHNIMAILFAPIVLLWSVFWLVSFKQKQKTFGLLLICISAFGLSAFFVLPAIFELSLINVLQNSGYYDFHQHFVTFNQLFFDRSFNYGPSGLGVTNSLSFQIGWPHWWLLALIPGIVIYFYRKSNKPMIYLISLFFLFSLASIFMTHAKSVLVWDKLSFLQFIQFPWRFLGLVIFTNAFLISLILGIFKKKWQVLLSGGLIAAVITLNMDYFKPEKFYSQLSDQQILSGELWKKQSRATLLDYMPVDVKDFPQGLAPTLPEGKTGKVKVLGFQKQSNYWEVKVQVESQESAAVIVPIFNFPTWETMIDNKKVDIFSSGNLGLIGVEIPSGEHTVIGRFQDTVLRKVANIVSLLTLVLLILFLIMKSKWQKA